MTSHCCYLFSPNHLQEKSSSFLHHSMLHFLFCMCSMIVHSDTNQQGKPVGLTDWTNRHAGKMNEVEPYQYNSSHIKIDGKKNEIDKTELENKKRLVSSTIRNRFHGIVTFYSGIGRKHGQRIYLIKIRKHPSNLKFRRMFLYSLQQK